MTLLKIAPWSGEAYNRQRPEANVRALSFGKNDEGWRYTSCWRNSVESS